MLELFVHEVPVVFQLKRRALVRKKFRLTRWSSGQFAGQVFKQSGAMPLITFGGVHAVFSLTIGLTITETFVNGNSEVSVYGKTVTKTSAENDN
jgi:hypothetical protein